jgi:hypothetical protein
MKTVCIDKDKNYNMKINRKSLAESVILDDSKIKNPTKIYN